MAISKIKETISKIRGTVEERRGENNAEIKVWAFKEGNQWYYSENDIIDEFGEYCKVFAGAFFNRYTQISLNNLVEISIKNLNHDATPYSSIHHTNCTNIGFRLVELPLNAFVSENSINLDVLSSETNTFSDIYFHNNDFLFGPFKNENQSIKPKIGKEVGKFKYTESVIIPSEDKFYILDAPREKICDVDCMTAAQSADFLKEKLRTVQGLDFDKIKKQIEKIELNGLDKDRLEKAKSYLNQIELNYTTVKNLIENNTDFQQIFEKAVESSKNEIKVEYEAKTIQPLKVKVEQVEKQIEAKKAEKEKADNQLNRINRELEPLRKEYEHLKSEKERLIEDIKVHALIQQTPSVQIVHSANFYTYEIQDFSRNVEFFKELNDFRKIIGDIEKSSLARRCFDLLKDYKCLLSNDIKMILALAKATNNCKVLIQQVEPDWLKFEHFYENGLKQIWQAAHQEPDKIYFFLLQDLNMASIECYGKPLLDLLAGIRVNLPMENTPFPKNLLIFGFPIETAEDDNFGLPLIKKTFKNWGGLPKTNEGHIINDIQSENKLTVAQVFEHDNISSGYLNDYFE
jgi:outer membrane murein-binding lipoprotein Lpp